MCLHRNQPWRQREIPGSGNVGFAFEILNEIMQPYTYYSTAYYGVGESAHPLWRELLLAMFDKAFFFLRKQFFTKLIGSYGESYSMENLQKEQA